MKIGTVQGRLQGLQIKVEFALVPLDHDGGWASKDSASGDIRPAIRKCMNQSVFVIECGGGCVVANIVSISDGVSPK